MIYILHPQKDVILGYLDREDYWADEHHQGLTGVHFMQFTTFSDTAEAGMLVDKCRLLRQASTGGWQEFVAYHIAVRGDRTKQVIATGAEAELDQLKIMEPGWRYGFTLEKYVDQALAGTGIQLGNIDYGGSKSRNFDKYMGAYAFLYRVATLYGREMRRRVEVIDNHIIGRYWDMVERLGSDKRHEIVAGENMAGITREVFSDRIVTALYCVGPEQEDGTRLTVLVTDEDAFQRWNRNGQHIIDFYEPETDDEEMTMERLTTLGTAALKKRITTVVEYTIEAAVLPDDDVELGDTQWIKDEGFNPPLYAESRAIFVIEPISGEVSKRTYKFGETKELKEEDVLKTFRHLQSVYGMRMVRSPVPPVGSPSKIWVKKDPEAPVGSALEIQHVWNADAGDWVKVTPTVAGEIGAEPEIPIGPLPPDPTVSKKWVDDSSDIAELKLWNETTQTWNSVQGPPGLQGIQGPQGDQGIPGVKGVDGQTSYTHIAYADSAAGGGISQDPTGKAYIGMYTDFIAADSADPSKYAWSLIKGADGSQGIPGPKGTDGLTPYLHIAYATNATGTAGFDTTVSVGKTYIGTYTDFVSMDSTDPAKYSWTLIKGEKGDTGAQGPNIVNSTTVIEADVIKSNHIDVSNLSAISANLGTITAGDIKGVTMNLGGGKFIVDNLGNVTFAGNLNGASGTFKGTLDVAGTYGRTLIQEGRSITNDSLNETIVSPGSFQVTFGNIGSLQNQARLTSNSLVLDEFTSGGSGLQMSIAGSSGGVTAKGMLINAGHYLQASSRGPVRFLTNGNTSPTTPDFNFESVESFRHARMQMGNMSIKSLNSSAIMMQFRNRADTAYGEIAAAAFTTVSKRESKKNIEEYRENALNGIMSTTPRTYHLNDDLDTEMKRIGLILDEAPVDIISISGEGIDGYEMQTYLWKGLQDLTKLFLDKGFITHEEIQTLTC